MIISFLFFFFFNPGILCCTEHNAFIFSWRVEGSRELLVNGNWFFEVFNASKKLHLWEGAPFCSSLSLLYQPVLPADSCWNGSAHWVILQDAISVWKCILDIQQGHKWFIKHTGYFTPCASHVYRYIYIIYVQKEIKGAVSLLRLSCSTWLHVISTSSISSSGRLVSSQARVPKTRAAEGQHQGQEPALLTIMQTNPLLFAPGGGFSLNFFFPFHAHPCVLQVNTHHSCTSLGFCGHISGAHCQGGWQRGELSGPCPQCCTQAVAVALAGVLICSEPSVMCDFCSLTGIQIAVN